ncbi:Serine/threonine-protein kinase PknD [Planctomycetes bacterium Poly30]|uniref:Serine/threonine-protein kinase PknD n=1 Tax=Saltatorellus ferox TaxID=2528018 RepID=A0A518EKH4_9BACT|nr:Serine/threonine-protein kinase PknD [Planctomycetes bacterium Poly30]
MDDREDQLLEDAGEVYADWRVAGHQASDLQAFEKLCARQPLLATYLKRIRRLDVGARQIAEEEGAAAGGLAFEGRVDTARTEIQDAARLPGKATEQRARATMEKARNRRLSFGKYHLTGLTSDWTQLGKGGAGSVYRAWDEDLARQVALKLLHKKFVDPDSGVEAGMRRRAQARFLHEAQLTAQLDHPGIVPLHDFGMTSTGRPYFTMKLVKGKTLGQVIELMKGRSASWTLTRTLGVLIKASEALAYAHAKGVIHRDLKPANIMVGKYGEVYVMDWGLLKKVERDGSLADMALTRFAEVPEGPELASAPADGITDHGDAIGTATYMSPEQALGDLEAVGRASDIYGLGAILYHILSGSPPFMEKGVLPGLLTILEAHRSGRGPESIDRVAPHAPAALRRIVTRAMAHEPAQRHGSVTEMANEVLAFLEGRVGKDWVASPLRSTLRWARRRPSAAALIVVGLVLAGAGFHRVLSPPEPFRGTFISEQPGREAEGHWIDRNGEEGLPEILELLEKLVGAEGQERDGVIEQIGLLLQRGGPDVPGEGRSR